LARMPSTSVTSSGSSYLGICRATLLRHVDGDHPPLAAAEEEGLTDDAISDSAALVGGCATIVGLRGVHVAAEQL